MWWPRMLETGNPWQVSVRCLGPIARQLLETQVSGRISAVFERAFYVSTNDGLFCVGTGAMYDGPLNVVTSAPETTVWRASGLRVGQPVSIGTGILSIGHDLVMPWRGSAEWLPAWPVNVDMGALARGLEDLRRAAVGRVPVEGLGLLIMPDRAEAVHAPVLAHARGPVSRLRTALHEALREGPMFRPAPSDVRALRGLGPGATPSGDDYIGGMLIGLHALGQGAFARDLWRLVDREAAAQGNVISDAHMRAASAGYGAAGLHAAAGLMLAGADGLRDRISEIDRIGHTSGWDALAGMVMVFDSVVCVSRRQSLNSRTK